MGKSALTVLITGPIGSGKSTIAGMLRRLAAEVIEVEDLSEIENIERKASRLSHSPQIRVFVLASPLSIHRAQGENVITVYVKTTAELIAKRLQSRSGSRFDVEAIRGLLLNQTPQWSEIEELSNVVIENTGDLAVLGAQAEVLHLKLTTALRNLPTTPSAEPNDFY